MELLLERPSTDSGFGFSVSWLRPPRIERVEPGKPASVAGLIIGDRILGVGGQIMDENVDIYHGIKGAGLKLKLTVERQRQTPWNKIHVRQELLTSLSDTQKRLFSAQLRFFKQTVSALDRYLIPAGKSGLMSQQEMKVIFGGVIGIITVMARLLHCVNRGDCGLEDANLDHLPELSTAYSEYAAGLPTSATTLSAKMADSKFTQFILSTQTPYDLTYVLFSPLYHLRQTLQLTGSSSFGAAASLHAQLLQMYTKLTTEHCILEPTPSPLITVQELESRLVSPTAAKQIKLTRWLFGSRLELRDGSSWSPVFGFLFSDLLLIVTQPTRDRLFFVKQQVWLKELASLHFSSGGDLDFKLVYAHVKRFRLLRSEKAVHLRVAGAGMKAMWKLLLQKQIIELNTVGFPSSSSAFSLSEFTEKFPDGGGGVGGAKRTVSAPETIQEQEEAADADAESDDIANNNNNQRQCQQEASNVKIHVQKPPPEHAPASATEPPVKPARVAKEAKAKAKASSNELKPESKSEPEQPKSNPVMEVPQQQPPKPAPRPKAEPQQQTPPIPAPRTRTSTSLVTSSSTSNGMHAAAASSAPAQKQPTPIPRPRSYQDSPAPQHRSYGYGYGYNCGYDPRVQRDYPELFGITPRDRRMFIKAIGERSSGSGIGSGSLSAGATPAMGVRPSVAIASYSMAPAPRSVDLNYNKPSAATAVVAEDFRGFDVDLDDDDVHDLEPQRPGSLPGRSGRGPTAAASTASYVHAPMAPKVDRNFMKLRSAQLRAALAPAPPQHHVPTSPELSSNDSGISDETTGGAPADHPRADAEVRHLPLEPMTLAPPHPHYFHSESTQQHAFAYKGTATVSQSQRDRQHQCSEFQQQQHPTCTRSQRGGVCGLDCVVDHVNHNHAYSHAYSNSHDADPRWSIAPHAQQPLLVKIVSPVRMSIVRHHNLNSVTSCTAVLEHVESTESTSTTEEEGGGSGSGSGSGCRSAGSGSSQSCQSQSQSQSDDAASASPVLGGGGGTTEPSWSSEEDLLDRDRPAAPVLPAIGTSATALSSKSVGSSSFSASASFSTYSGHGHGHARAPNPIANFYKLTDLSESDGDGDGEVDADVDEEDPPTLNRYESYERLDRLSGPHLPRSTACFGLADADKDDAFDEGRFGLGVGLGLDDRYDFLSDEEEGDGDGYGGDVDLDVNAGYGEYPEQIEDNTYSVSRLGPLPPVLEEEFEEDEEAFLQEEEEMYEAEEEERERQRQRHQEQASSPSTSARSCSSRQSQHSRSSYNFTVARIAGLYARTSISPLRILRDLWLRRRLRERDHAPAPSSSK